MKHSMRDHSNNVVNNFMQTSDGHLPSVYLTTGILIALLYLIPLI